LIKVLGEAANRVSKETQAKHPRIPWAQIITRNRLIHGYDFVDLDILWRTVTDNPVSYTHLTLPTSDLV